MMVEPQRIFTDTTTQDALIDFRVLAGSLSHRRRFPPVMERDNFWYPVHSQEVDVDIGSEVVEAKQWSPEKMGVLLASFVAVKPTTSLPDTTLESEESEFPTLFSARYKRKVLFSQEVEIQSGNLRRWRPQHTFDFSLLSEEDDV